MPEPQDTSAAVEAIKDAIAAIILPIAPTAQVIKRFVFDPNEDNWVGLLRSAADLDANGDQRIHTICVYYDGWDFIDPGLSSTLAAINPLLPIGISFFHGYDLGTDTTNSEKRLQKEIIEVMFTLAQKTDLNVRDYVKGHRGLRVPRLNLKLFGQYPVQYALGRLEVLLQSRVVR